MRGVEEGRVPVEKPVEVEEARARMDEAQVADGGGRGGGEEEAGEGAGLVGGPEVQGGGEGGTAEEAPWRTRLVVPCLGVGGDKV